jgi:WD40 repeat protein
MAFHPREPRLAIAHQNGIQIRDCETGDVVTDLPGAGDTEALAWRPDGETLAAANSNRIVYLWHVPTRTQTVRLDGITNRGFQLAFNRTGDLLASQAWGAKLRLWDPSTGEETLSTPSPWCIQPRFGAGDRLLAADRHGDQLWLWGLATSRVYRSLAGGLDWASPRHYRRTAFCTEGRVLACTMASGLGFWDARSGAPLAFAPIGSVNPVVCAGPDALLTNDQPGGVRRWPVRVDPKAPGLVRVGPPEKLPLPGTWDTEVACSADGKVSASALFVETRVWRQGSNQAIHLSPDNDARNVSVSIDGRWVVSGNWNSVGARVWDAQTGKLVTELVSREPYVVPRFSPDGRWLATQTDQLRLWTAGTWEKGPCFGEAVSYAFSPDGKLLAVETNQGVVRLVGVDDGREYARLDDGSQTRTDVSFSPDGTQLALSGIESKGIRVWDLRALREELAARGLDWDLPPYPPTLEEKDAPPLRVVVDLGELGPK